MTDPRTRQATIVFALAFIAFGVYQGTYAQLVYRQSIAGSLATYTLVSGISALLLLFPIPQPLRDGFFSWRSHLVACVLAAYTIIVSLYLGLARATPAWTRFAVNGYLLIGIELLSIALTIGLMITSVKKRDFHDIAWAVLFAVILFGGQLLFIGLVGALFSFGGMQL